MNNPWYMQLARDITFHSIDLALAKSPFDARKIVDGALEGYSVNIKDAQRSALEEHAWRMYYLTKQDMTEEKIFLAKIQPYAHHAGGTLFLGTSTFSYFLYGMTNSLAVGLTAVGISALILYQESKYQSLASWFAGVEPRKPDQLFENIPGEEDNLVKRLANLDVNSVT